MKPYSTGRVRRWLWVVVYRLEDARLFHGGLGNYWRQAAACIALGVLRLLRLA